MIVFHEGLPGSGKSYEACVMHILPALKAGRDVLTNINGINHQMFAELTGIPLPIVLQKLVCISHSDCDDEAQRLELVKADILALTKKDSLVVIDEIQDIHPTKRQPLSAEWSKYISSHRHEGLDIVLMGQDRRDVHPIWRRRINRLLTFNKLSAVGKPSSYVWVCYEATRPEKFNKVSSGTRAYDSKYYGLYLSHTAGTTNKSLYSDDRANLLKNKNFWSTIVGVLAVAIWGIYHLVSFFHHDEPPSKQEPVHVQAPAPVPVPQQKKVSQPVQTVKPADDPKVVPPQEDKPIDIFDQEAKRGRLRLAAVVQSSDKSKIYFRVEIIDAYGRLFASYDRQSLLDLGWRPELHSFGLSLNKDGATYVVRPWALERAIGQVPQRTLNSFAR